MPFDLDRIIDHQLYLATQQCIQPYAQQRRVSSAPASTAAAAGPAPRTAGARKSSLGSLVSPVLAWGSSSGGGGGGSSNSRSKSPVLYHHRSRPPAQKGYSPVDLFFTAPVGVPVRGGSGISGSGGHAPAQLARDDSSSSSLDQFVTAPVGDFTTSAADVLRPSQQHGNGSRPGSSDSNWSFATASGGSGSGTFSGLETTVDLTPSPPPSAQPGKLATHTSAAEAPKPPPDPSLENRQSVGGGSAITLQVQDLQHTKRFYRRIFGAPCLSSSEDGTSAVLSLNGGGLVVTLRESSPDARVGDGAGGRGVLLTVPVDDVDAVCRRLRRFAEDEEEGEEVAGQRFAEPMDGPGGARVVTFCDPAGHRWQVGQGLEDP